MPDRTRSTHPPISVGAYDLETISPAQHEDGSFPPWETHVPVAVGFARTELRGGDYAVSLHASVATPGGEAKLMVELDRHLATVERACGFNSRGFDAPVARMAALRARQFSLPALASHAGSYRYASEHIDLLDQLTSQGAARRLPLSAVAAELGVPVKTTAHGGDVAEQWRAGEHETIRRYVMEDAVVTLVLYHAWAAFQIADEAQVTRPLTAIARMIDTTPDLSYLRPIADCDLVRWARPRALRAQVADALASASAKLKRDEVEKSFVDSEVVPLRRP